MPKDLFDVSFEEELQRHAPLADRLRPETLDEYIGQKDIIGKGKLLRRAIEQDELFSIIFWGPPGSGKTTLARIIAKITKSHFVQISAVTAGIKDLRVIVNQARERRKFQKERTVLFVDEIHRWNKAQQDAFLPHVENGTVILIGATTENPSFEVIAPLLSRSRVFVLQRLSEEELQEIVQWGLSDKKRGLQAYQATIHNDARDLLISASNGDARTLLNALEVAVKATLPNESGKREITLDVVEDALQHKALQYDKNGEEHYNVISAFIKSMRGSNVDGALYWLNRMIEAGEDPLFIARRMVVFASEDVGMADPLALRIALDVFEACEKIGYPECQINLGHGAAYLALAPKDNSAYVGLLKAKEDVQNSLNEPVPLHLRNAVTGLVKDLGYGKGYKYSHDFDAETGKQDYLPKKFTNKKYYVPKNKQNT